MRFLVLIRGKIVFNLLQFYMANCVLFILGICVICLLCMNCMLSFKIVNESSVLSKCCGVQGGSNMMGADFFFL